MDLGRRVIVAHVWRELDVTPTDVVIPFAILKGIFGSITVAEAEAEKQQLNGGPKRLVKV